MSDDMRVHESLLESIQGDVEMFSPHESPLPSALGGNQELPVWATRYGVAVKSVPGISNFYSMIVLGGGVYGTVVGVPAAFDNYPGERIYYGCLIYQQQIDAKTGTGIPIETQGAETSYGTATVTSTVGTFGVPSVSGVPEFDLYGNPQNENLFLYRNVNFLYWFGYGGDPGFDPDWANIFWAEVTGVDHVNFYQWTIASGEDGTDPDHYSNKTLIGTGALSGAVDNGAHYGAAHDRLFAYSFGAWGGTGFSLTFKDWGQPGSGGDYGSAGANWEPNNDLTGYDPSTFTGGDLFSGFYFGPNPRPAGSIVASGWKLFGTSFNPSINLFRGELRCHAVAGARYWIARFRWGRNYADPGLGWPLYRARFDIVSSKEVIDHLEVREIQYTPGTPFPLQQLPSPMGDYQVEQDFYFAVSGEKSIPQFISDWVNTEWGISAVDCSSILASGTIDLISDAAGPVL